MKPSRPLAIALSNSVRMDGADSTPILRLISNDDNRSHGQFLRGCLTGCYDGFGAVAFVRRLGLKQIERELRAFLVRGGCFRLVVGTDFHLTEPGALRVLLGLEQEFPHFEWRLVAQSPTSTFHPKYYRFRGDGRICVLAGSSNLTMGGLGHNIEVSAVCEDEEAGLLAKEAERIETALWENERCQKANERIIGEYAVGFELNRRRMAEAAGLLKQDLEGLPKLNEEALEAELRSYRSDEKEQEKLKSRRSNYEEASQIIRAQFLGAHGVGSYDFAVAYEKLVGRRGEIRLWHSGSVFRHKSKVMRQHDEVLAMVREIAANLDGEPEALYEIGLRWVKEIDGLGPNIFTEFCNTLRPDRYAPLNNNPVTSLKALGIDEFPAPNRFKADDYGRFCRCLNRLREHCGFADLGETDHFLNFVYWRHKEKMRKQAARNEP